MLDIFWIVPLPLLITLLITFFIGNKLGKKIALPSIIGALTSMVLSLSFLPSLNKNITKELEFNWFLDVNLGFYIDSLTIILLAVVSILIALIAIYSYGYMQEEKAGLRFFCLLQLFSFSMLEVIIGNNLLQTFIFWEIMGLCSYALIGFWFHKKSAAKAGKKAFLTTRVGDVMMLLGIIFIYTKTGSLEYSEIFRQAEAGLLDQGALTFFTLCIFGGVVGKSAQFPLHVWLPDAMEGPTPVSALIHAATMVKAGIYLIIRLFPLFILAPLTLKTMLVLGSITVLGAALLAMVAREYKQVLAYSTLSQLGYMVVGLGALGSVASLLHLVNHAFFKALLFLGAGAVIHIVGTNDIFKMGAVRKYNKILSLTVLIATLSIAGIPPFSGFWSKDEILMQTFYNTSPVVFLVLAITSFLTAFYMFRLYFLVFTGEEKSEYPNHKLDWSMQLPLVILSIFALFGGLFTRPISKAMFLDETAPASIFVVLLSICLAVAGLLLAAYIYYWQKLDAEKIRERFSLAYNILENRFYIDRLYEGFCSIVLVGLAQISNFFDRRLIDGFINLLSILSMSLARLSSIFDKKIVDGAINGLCSLVVLSGRGMRRLSTGKIQQYLVVMTIGLATILLVILGRSL